MRSFSVPLALALLTTPAFSSLEWNITYNDVVNGTGVGFDDSVFGETRRATFESVTGYISSVVDGSGTVDFLVNASESGGRSSLASAGTHYFGGPNGFSNGFLFEHATTGIDPYSKMGDGYATFDFGYDWNSGTDLPTGSEFDLYSISLHEITHALGFATLTNSDGDSWASGENPGVYSVLNSYLELDDGTPLFNTDGGASFLGNADDLISGDVFFAGPNAMAANGGDPVKIYAPGSYVDGSSISHIDDSIDAVMNHSIARGVSKRTYSDVEIGVLQDIGWTAIPEPASTVFFLFGSLALVRRRR